MKVIKPSAHIIDYGDMTLLEKIELAGRLCYKSEDKITPGSAEKFVADVIKRGHMSVLEMGHVTVSGRVGVESFFFFLETKPKYFSITYDNYNKTLTVSATPRAIIEHSRAYPRDYVSENLQRFLCNNFPVLCGESGSTLFSNSGIREQQHTYYGVRFIIGRHASHELVRHRPIGVLQESQRYCNYSLDKFNSEVTFIEPVGMTNISLWREAMLDAEEAYFELLRSNSPQVARTVLPNSTKTEVIIYANVPQWQHMLRLRTTPACDPSMLEVMVPLKEEFKVKGVEV